MISASQWVREASKCKGKDIAAFVKTSRENIRHIAETSQVYADLDWNKINAFQAFGQLQIIILPYAIKETQANEKNWIARIYSNGVCVKEDKFSGSYDAEHWSDLRLFEASSDSYAEVFSYQVRGIVKIHRQDAIARIMKRRVGPVMKQTAKTTSRLGFGHKAHEKKYYFSRG